MSRLRIATVVLMLLGVGAAGAGTSTSGPLVGDGSLQAGGRPLGNSGPAGVEIRFFQRTRFGIGLVFHNKASHDVTVVGARVLAPAHSIVRQTGTRLVSWNPRPCPPHILGCPVEAFLSPSFIAGRPQPVTVAPGKGLGVELDFRLGSCPDVSAASFGPVALLQLRFRDMSRELVRLKGGTIRPDRPPARACSR